MENLGLNQIRELFLSFWESKEHFRAKSASLIPDNDKSLMLINSGMAPLKPYFSGALTPPSKRMTTCQKCIRTNDIENVGKTARHGTFFEMLGNFSFGDYFKEESLRWGYEFITEQLKMPIDKIWATIYQDDDQAHDIWISIGMPEERIVRLGKDDNFWEIGLGPCGPCSEIYFDRGPEYGCGKSDCKPGCDCDRYLEFWNHVFTQFNRNEDGTYSNLEHPNIDTGMGLERMACIMQGVDSIFDIDTIKHIRDAITAMAKIEYQSGDSKHDISVRIITDHLRSMVFMIGDGVLPGNEGRGYVLRRIIRRAARHAKLIGINDKECLNKLAKSVMDVSGEAYPEIVEKSDYIFKIIRLEEQKFGKTLDNGLSILEDYIQELKSNNSSILPGELAFKLYDTYGFPLEVTSEILEEQGLSVDIDGFESHMQEQKNMARAGRRSTDEEAWREGGEYNDLEPTIFVGYESDKSIGKLLYKGDYNGKNAFMIFDKSPFYATMGGQIHDNGIIKSDKLILNVIDVIKENGIFLHVIEEPFSKIDNIELGQEFSLEIDTIRRHKIQRNHSATHLMQQALKDVLGEHVAQAGSYVDDEYLRFDFNHFEAMTQEQIIEVERIVNAKIDDFLKINMQEMPIEDAKKLGATAIFGEKYGDMVRVVSMGDYSVEFCGGTHLNNTGKIGAFKIKSESGVASGVRRIEAVTGTNVAKLLTAKNDLIAKTCEELKTKESELLIRASQIVKEKKELEQKLKTANSQALGSSIDTIISQAVKISDINFISYTSNEYDMEALRSMSDAIKQKLDSVIMVFASNMDSKLSLMVAVSDDLVSKGFHAGKLIKEIATICGGSGGGKANMAQAGAKDSSKLDEAFAKARQIIEETK